MRVGGKGRCHPRRPSSSPAKLRGVDDIAGVKAHLEQGAIVADPLIAQ